MFLDLFSDLMVYCHLVFKIVFPQSKVTDINTVSEIHFLNTVFTDH